MRQVGTQTRSESSGRDLDLNHQREGKNQPDEQVGEAEGDLREDLG